MAEFSNEVVKSFRASASIPAFVVVTPAATNAAVEVALWATALANILGASKHAASTGGGLAIVIGGSARVLAGASISAGALLSVQTATGFAVEMTANNTGLAASLTATVIPKQLGLALSNATASGTVQVLLGINNVRLQFF